MLAKVEMLERLTTLWKSGTLSDAEFAEEKRKLLAGFDEHPAVVDEPSGWASESSALNPTRLGLLAGGVALIGAALLAFSVFSSGSSSSTGEGAAPLDGYHESSSGRDAAAPGGDVSALQPDIVFQDENEYIARIATDPGLSKQLGTSAGKIVQFRDYNVYSRDQSEWEAGGPLSLLNDYSLGRETRIECQLSPSDGDAFLKDTSRRHVAIKGRIQSFSSASGLTISPCVVS